MLRMCDYYTVFPGDFSLVFPVTCNSVLGVPLSTVFTAAYTTRYEGV